MAYIIWKVFMKKYTRVRLGLHGSPVTPSSRHALTYDEESWKPKPEDRAKDNPEDISRGSEVRQSKAKRVKNYLKKCKNALGNRSSSYEQSTNEETTPNTSSWYLEKQLEEAINESEINELEDVFEDAQVSLNLGDHSGVYQKAHLVEVKASNTNIKKSLEHSHVETKKNRVESVKSVEKLNLTTNSDGASQKNQTTSAESDEVNKDSNTDVPTKDYKSRPSEAEIEQQLPTVEEGSTDSDGIAASTISPPLKQSQGQGSEIVGVVSKESNDEESNDSTILRKTKKDVASLVDKYFGSLYTNYEHSKKCLVRQARDLLVCEYRGCLQRFENEFCIQASKLLQHLKNGCTSDGRSPSGWPLCLGPSGVVIHLNPLDPSVIRNRDCYLCVRNRSAPGLEVTLIWRKLQQIHCHTIAEFRNPLQNLDDIMCSSLRSVSDLEISSYDDYDGSELPELLQNLLVSIEHAIARIPLDDLTFPCPQCLQYMPLDRDDETNNVCACQCSCKITENTVTKKDSSIQTSPMFEYAGSIPHIDSDEDDDKESIKSGCSNKRIEITPPRQITELPDKLLMSGIYLPGTEDLDGRPVMICYADCITKAGLNKYEIGKLLLYYSSIPPSENKEKGFTILLITESDDHTKSLGLLDKAICLITNHIKVSRFLIWRPTLKNSVVKSLASRVQTIVVTDETSLAKYISKEQAPASCSGTCNHDQLEWVEFFKQLEPFLADCKTVGQELLTTLSQLRNEELPSQITRRFLHHQCRQISKALQLECLQKLRKEARQTLHNLEERSQWISHSKDVRRSSSFALESFSSVERVAKRLEQLEQERRERLKELARLKTMQDETEELITWIRRVGDETLNKLTVLLRTAINSAGVKDVSNEFEKFFFDAWRQIEKSNDLVEECKNVREPRRDSVKELATSLQNSMKLFREQLEDTRLRLEDTSRCFLLLESCDDILEDDNKEQDKFIQLAMKCGNDKLKQICKTVENQRNETKPSRPPDKVEVIMDKTTCPSPQDVSITSTPIKSQNTQIRRRSVSSHAFIYHCNHHAAGELCNCCESDTENTISYKLKKKYIQILRTQGCMCNSLHQKDTLERKNSATLDGIKEERESVEDLLEKIVSDDCRRCDSGLSTADNSIGEESVYKKKFQRTCSCQYYSENCASCSAPSSSTGSNPDHTDNQRDLEDGSECFLKSNSSDDIEEEHYSEERRKVPPVSANSHLYCHASTLDLPSDALYRNMEPKTQKTLKYIIKEMIETERDYVKSLDYIIVNYIPELNREDIPQALRGQRNVVFGNVEKIYEFHSQHFLRELEDCENNPLQVGQIFLKYNSRFYLYALYNKNKPKSDSLMSEYGSMFFKSKQIELGDKMDLASYLLKPVQRMGKYALLLQQMMKACPSTSSSSDRVIQEFEDLKQAEEMVKFQLRHGNDLLAMDSIRECDVNLKEQGRLLRQNEFLLWEGRSGKKSLRQVFLFEELILFSKARRLPDRNNLDLYIYKNSIKMSDIGLTAKIGDSPTKFEIWFRKRKPNDTFTLQSMSAEVKKAWTEELYQILWKQAIKNRAARLAEMSSMGIGNKPCLEIRPSKDQISDRSISFAQLSRNNSEDVDAGKNDDSQEETRWNTLKTRLFIAAPRFRSSIAGSVAESCRSTKRPHSVISMSSLSSSSTSSGHSASTPNGQPNSLSLSFESSSENPRTYDRSATLNSQCSVESGIIADLSLGSDESSEQTQTSLLDQQSY